jgi:hypothetical protein
MPPVPEGANAKKAPLIAVVSGCDVAAKEMSRVALSSGNPARFFSAPARHHGPDQANFPKLKLAPLFRTPFSPAILPTRNSGMARAGNHDPDVGKFSTTLF